MAKMLRAFLVISAFCVLSACGGSETVTKEVVVPEPPVIRSIVGSWGFVAPGTSCEEKYYFYENGTVEINSGSEIVQGVYSFEEVTSGTQRHELMIMLLFDNGGIDCQGSTANNAGNFFNMYVAFDGDDEISWYVNRDGGLPVVTMIAVEGTPNSEAPYLNLGGNIYANERDTISISAETDAPAGTVYSWTQVYGPEAALSNADSLNVNIDLPSVDADTYLVFKLALTTQNGVSVHELVRVYVNAYTNIGDISLPDEALSSCISGSAGNDLNTEVSTITSLSCEGVSDVTGLEGFTYLTHLDLSNNSLGSLASILDMTQLESLNLSGNESLACEELDALEASLSSLVEFIHEDRCVVNKAIELGAIGFDIALDEVRNNIYVSIPSQQEIAVISADRTRVIDRIRLSGSPYGIDLSIDGSSLYAAVRGTDSIAMIDLDSREVTMIPLANQTGNAQLYDIIEAAPNRVFVSASPGSSGFAYIAQVDLSQSNLASRAASNRIIRASPTFARSPDYSSLYVSEAFYPNSLYKLNLNDSSAPIVLEDDHGSVSGVFNMAVNPSGTRIALASGQVLRTGSFIEAGRVSPGLSTSSAISDRLFVLSNNSNIDLYEYSTLDLADSVRTNCNYGTTIKFGVLEGIQANVFLQQDVICMSGYLSQSGEVDPYPLLTFYDLALEECVIAQAEANGYTTPAELTELDCSGSEKNIISLESIDKLENLHTIDLSGSSVLSIEPLATLANLSSVTIRNSALSSVSPLSTLGSLVNLDVTGNQRIPCDELHGFQVAGVNVYADLCTDSARIELGAIGADMEYNPLTQKLYVSTPSTQRISEIDITTREVSNTYPVGGSPQGIDISSDGQTVYAALHGVGDIAYLSTSSGSVETVDISTELADDRTWDIAEVSPNRIVVSSNPYSNGFAYIVEVRRDLDNAAKRVASNRIIRAGPVFSVANDGSAVYVGEGFSPNSLYKLDATLSTMPIVTEDNHGDVTGTSHLALNNDGSLIYLASGQVLSTGDFVQQARFQPGASWVSQNGDSLYIADGESSAVGIYDINTTAKTGRQEFGCDVSSIKVLQEMAGLGISVLGDDLVCFARVVPFD